MIADLAERGLVSARSWLSRAENGAPMREDLLRAFEDYYGSVAPPYEPPMTSSAQDATKPELVALLQAQTEVLNRQSEALEALADESREATLAVTGSVVGFGCVLGVVAERLEADLPQSGGGPRRRGPAGTEGQP